MALCIFRSFTGKPAIVQIFVVSAVITQLGKNSQSFTTWGTNKCSLGTQNQRKSCSESIQSVALIECQFVAILLIHK